MISRRSLVRACLFSLFGKAFARAAGPGFDPVAFTLRGLQRGAGWERRYRIDATILLLGAPLFTRPGVGGGYASVESNKLSDSGRDAAALALQFAAGSFPARAHGLNRFGILREGWAARLQGSDDGVEISFAGLMTRSREENFEQARRALAASDGHGAEGVVARGRTFANATQTWMEDVALPAGSDWSNLNATLNDALRAAPLNPPRETASGAATTFLFAMRDAALSTEPTVRREFVHAGKLYWLETQRHPGSKEPAVELAGTIHNSAGVRTAEFRTAYAPGDPSGIPVRIEYRPRSFLRLTFVAELDSTQPIPSAFPEESA